MAVQGKSITLPSGSGAWAAIDTGTTGIGMPSDIIASIFAQVPGAQKATGQFDGYWTYRAYLFSRPQPLITSVLIITSLRLHQLTHPSPLLFTLSTFVLHPVTSFVYSPAASLHPAPRCATLRCHADGTVHGIYLRSHRIGLLGGYRPSFNNNSLFHERKRGSSIWK